MLLKISNLDFNKEKDEQLLNQINLMKDIEIDIQNSQGCVHYLELNNLPDMCKFIIRIENILNGNFKYTIVDEQSKLAIRTFSYNDAIRCLEYIENINKRIDKQINDEIEEKMYSFFKISSVAFVILFLILLFIKIMRAL